MSLLEKGPTLYERNDDGELIPQQVKLQLLPQDAEDYPDLKDKEILIIPLTRGEIKEMFGAAVEQGNDVKEEDTDAKLIIKKCKNPQYTEEEMVHAKPVFVRSIVRTILTESGVKIDSSGTRKIDKDTDEFGKNS